VRAGHILLEEYHLERLSTGCKQLLIAPPALAALKRELGQAARDQAQAILNLILTRGSAGPDGRAARDSRTTRILSLEPWPEYPDQWAETGIRLRICDTHVGRNRRLAGLKHLNRLEQVLARSEWTDADNIQEGLMLDEEGSVIGGTATNVFAWLSHGVLATPVLRLSGVEGVMRRWLLEQAAQHGIQTRIASLSLTELMKAAEIFVCNSVIGVWPVAAIGAWKFRIGPMTRQAQQWAKESS
jgi:4-amino-4-deoxychorismate lyase